VLANYGFAAVFAAPKVSGLRQVPRIEAKGQSYGSPKNGRSETNHLAIAGCQSWVMLGRNCRALRPRLEKVVAVGGGNSDYFSSYCPSLLIKTIFWAYNYEMANLLRIFGKKSFYCTELSNTLYMVATDHITEMDIGVFNPKVLRSGASGRNLPYFFLTVYRFEPPTRFEKYI
jgi:hypothetical protein